MSQAIADILIKAKQNLIDFGIGSGTVVDAYGKVCALGAIYVTEGIIERINCSGVWDYKVVNGNKSTWDYPVTDAVQALANVIESRFTGTASTIVYRWNDGTRNLSTILDTFDKAIAMQ